ncbi:amino acid ABC transporter permease [Pelagibacterium halotolerans]|uniref:Putative ABC transporter, permease n=1 Tax=Pelagibacterium halotolerans (strain DSM 22347 / JCM 15775 / CGMCC 1.7692 / B2) TaxID=1082931 RepID=G4R8C5_PELHB|nr:amino acid ABC transporter permease [Pelagibacterium halotolerans]AEQ52369.1 putative ABC transporter, permease [Pelagibacterium halotolerans B2]QJR17892.1 amino acid ABC transporter permease [Pelagibacterium halotolerans]SEA34529.1 polar amino acid transport system permease protein [Pelagibacterium halotolerans]
MSASVIAEPGPVRIVRRRRWGAWLLGAVTLAILGLLAIAAVRAEIMSLEVFFTYLTSGQVLIGAGNAVLVGTVAMAVAVVVGLIVALMRLSGNPILSSLAATFVYFFRGTPMLIQILFWYNAFPTMFPRLEIGLPFSGDLLFSAPMPVLVTPFIAAVLGLGLAEGAYMSEIIRGGILAVDKGQRSAARAIGMRHGQVLWQVVIPQAARIIIPATGNQYIMLLKSTSLASVIGFLELLRITQGIYSANFRVVELLAVAAFWYLAMTAVVTVIQTILEKTFPVR